MRVSVACIVVVAVCGNTEKNNSMGSFTVTIAIDTSIFSKALFTSNASASVPASVVIHGLVTEGKRAVATACDNDNCGVVSVIDAVGRVGSWTRQS